MISNERIQYLHKNGVNREGQFIVYWMQGAQRVLDNHALEFAILKANELNVPLIVAFVIIPDFPSANARHFLFMLEGLLEVSKALKARGIGFYLQKGQPLEQLLKLEKSTKVLIMDKGYGTYEREIRAEVTAAFGCDAYEIDTNLVVPVETAYQKEAYAAYAIRPSIMRLIDQFNERCEERLPHIAFVSFQDLDMANSLEIDNPVAFMAEHLSHLESLPKITGFYGGTSQAINKLEAFVEDGLALYENKQSDPGSFGTSKLSPYLHFGQIAPVTILSRVENKSKAFVEQLVVRRELAYNYIYFSGDNRLTLKETLPSWAYESLMAHASDTREYLYNLSTLESGKTHDPYWNAAQLEMVLSGHMHNTMRMYWGKKIIEWTNHPEKAYEWMRYLNDKYSLDGRDPNGYAGIAWCFGKHDRPWRERAIFGKIRYMNDKGLIRKYNMTEYLAHVAQLRGADFE